MSEKAAPGLCSIIISAVGIIGGVWMDVDGLGGGIKKVAEVLPFYHGVKLSIIFKITHKSFGGIRILSIKHTNTF